MHSRIIGSDFKVTTIITNEAVEDLLCSAFEGGSNYWAQAEAHTKPRAGATYLHQYPIREGSVIITDMENGGRKYTLDRSALQRGLEAMSKLEPGKGSHHWADLLKGDTDATTGDVFLQMCLFGEIMYG